LPPIPRFSVSPFSAGFRFIQQRPRIRAQSLETIMAHILHLQQTPRPTLDRVHATIRAIARAVAAEHTLALRAATKANTPRQRLAELRAMYVTPLDPHQESDVDVRFGRNNTYGR
jgi:hypothetical protein